MKSHLPSFLEMSVCLSCVETVVLNLPSTATFNTVSHIMLTLKHQIISFVTP